MQAIEGIEGRNDVASASSPEVRGSASFKVWVLGWMMVSALDLGLFTSYL